MPTWLDEFALFIAARAAAEIGHYVDVREAVLKTTQTAMRHLETGRDPTGSLRFAADLYPFFAPAFKQKCLSLHVSPTLAQALSARSPTLAERTAYSWHLLRYDFTAIDCPDGAFALDDEVEIKALFVRPAMMIDALMPTSVRARETPRYDIIIGRRGRFSRQRLSWCEGAAGADQIREERATGDPDLLRETLSPYDLMDRAGWSLDEIIAAAGNFVIKTVAYARRHRGSALVTPMAKTESERNAFRRARPSNGKTILDTLSLRSFLEETETMGHG